MNVANCWGEFLTCGLYHPYVQINRCVCYLGITHPFDVFVYKILKFWTWAFGSGITALLNSELLDKSCANKLISKMEKVSQDCCEIEGNFVHPGGTNNTSRENKPRWFLKNGIEIITPFEKALSINWWGHRLDRNYSWSSEAFSQNWEWKINVWVTSFFVKD